MSSGRNERTPVQERPRARDPLERERPANRRANLNDLELARRADEVDDPALQEWVDVHLLDGAKQCLELRQPDGGAKPAQWMAVQLIVEDAQLVVGVRVPERRTEQEPIELRLWQRERAFLLDRVLGRDQEERRGQRAGGAVDGDLLLGHRLEQRRLRLRQRPVHLVDEQHVREDGAGAELECAILRVPDREPGDVGRLQVRRALDASGHRAVDAPRDRAGEDGLRSARDVLEQHVAARREGGDHERDRLALAEHDGLDIPPQTPGDLDRLVERHGVGRFTHRPILASAGAGTATADESSSAVASLPPVPSVVRYLTVRRPDMPSSACRGTSQMYGTLPAFLKTTEKV